jgi:lysozyme
MIYSKAKAIALITEFEGFSATAYKLPGEIYYTIGYGESNARIKADSVTTKEEALQFVNKRLIELSNQINKLVNVPLTEGQYCAILSFAYNVGINAFSASTLLKELNNRNYVGASEQFKRWVKGCDSKPMGGLVRRRASEVKLFLSDSV